MMADRAPTAGFDKRAYQLPVKDINTSASQVLQEGNLIGKDGGGPGGELFHSRLLDSTLCPQPVHRLLIQDIVLMACLQDRQKVEPRFGKTGAEGGKALAADLGGVSVAPEMAGAGIINSDEGRRNQPGMQNGTVFLDERRKVGGEQSHDLSLRDLDADAVENRG
ncbi:hypothetical protein [Rhizobium sp. BK491]|uniref:hypothetical protein n=1 Tax=Rhizobium sp. BK491 TaxID=2587009 RepID=UPI0032B226F5